MFFLFTFCDCHWLIPWSLPFLLGLIFGTRRIMEYKARINELEYNRQKNTKKIIALEEDLNISQRKLNSSHADADRSRQRITQVEAELALAKGSLYEIEEAKESQSQSQHIRTKPAHKDSSSSIASAVGLGTVAHTTSKEIEQSSTANAFDENLPEIKTFKEIQQEKLSDKRSHDQNPELDAPTASVTPLTPAELLDASENRSADSASTNDTAIQSKEIANEDMAEGHESTHEVSDHLGTIDKNEDSINKELELSADESHRNAASIDQSIVDDPSSAPAQDLLAREESQADTGGTEQSSISKDDASALITDHDQAQIDLPNTDQQSNALDELTIDELESGPSSSAKDLESTALDETPTNDKPSVQSSATTAGNSNANSQETAGEGTDIQKSDSTTDRTADKIDGKSTEIDVAQTSDKESQADDNESSHTPSLGIASAAIAVGSSGILKDNAGEREPSSSDPLSKKKKDQIKSSDLDKSSSKNKKDKAAKQSVLPGSIDKKKKGTSDKKKKNKLEKKKPTKTKLKGESKKSSKVASKKSKDKALKKKKNQIDSGFRPATSGKFEKVDENDLAIIEGIGPKTADLLKKNGISSWTELATKAPSELKDVLSAAGSRFSHLDPSTWTRQANLAAGNHWTRLEKLQNKLDGGKVKAGKKTSKKVTNDQKGSRDKKEKAKQKSSKKDTKAKKPKKTSVSRASQSIVIGADINQNNFEVIEGVGPKMNELLNKEGIKSWKDLSSYSPGELRSLLDKHGDKYRIVDVKLWPKQASFAAKGQWSKLIDFQKADGSASKAEKVLTKAGVFKSNKVDDLKLIEGIGPKIEKVLNKAGIANWTTLSKTSKSRLTEIMDKAGKRFAFADTSSWPKQATLAAAGKFDQLEKLQQKL